MRASVNTTEEERTRQGVGKEGWSEDSYVSRTMRPFVGRAALRLPPGRLQATLQQNMRLALNGSRTQQVTSCPHPSARWESCRDCPCYPHCCRQTHGAVVHPTLPNTPHSTARTLPRPTWMLIVSEVSSTSGGQLKLVMGMT